MYYVIKPNKQKDELLGSFKSEKDANLFIERVIKGSAGRLSEEDFIITRPQHDF